MAYRGKYKVKNPLKYKGDFRSVTYRSLWERTYMQWCDGNDSVIQWNSEEIIVPYKCPTDGKMHRYFTDFWMKIRTKDGEIKEYLIEIKPHKETLEPVEKQTPTGRKSRRYLNEVYKYAKNQAKWEAATHYADRRNMTFKVLTEYDIGIKRKSTRKKITK